MENGSMTETLLSEVYRNLTEGSENLGNVVPMIKDRFMMQSVTGQMEQYSAFTKEATGLLMRRAVKPEKRTAVKKLLSRSGMALNTLFDSTDGHLADIIVKGTEAGAQSLEKTLCAAEAGGVSAEAASLARAVVEFERRSAAEMKDFT